jgi:hypothetical protein
MKSKRSAIRATCGALVLALLFAPRMRGSVQTTHGTQEQCDRTLLSDPTASLDSLVFVELAGAYELTMVATSRTGLDTIVSGTLTLAVAGEANPHGNSLVVFPLYGWTDVDLVRLGVRRLAHPASDDSPDRPGVQAHHNIRTGDFSLVLGNTFDGVLRLHQGVFLSVTRADRWGLAGSWFEGGARLDPPPLVGYFCAVRANQ